MKWQTSEASPAQLRGSGRLVSDVDKEFNGAKGAAEIFSCIFKYLKQHVITNTGIYPRKLRIMADNCGGQNKNNKIVLALLRLIHMGYFNRIELAFMLPGHSYLPCDQHFGVITRNLNKESIIASPESLKELMATARKKEYKVYDLKRDEIVDLDDFTAKVLDKKVALIRTSNYDPKVFSTSSVIVMKISKKIGVLPQKPFI